MWQLVDDYLDQARALLGTGAPPLPAARRPQTANPTTPGTWTGPAADTATDTTQALGTARGQLGSARSRTDVEVTSAADISRNAHRGLNAIETGWKSDKVALAPFAETPEGQAALNRAGQQCINETQALVNDIATQFGTAAVNVRNAQLGLPTTDDPAASAPDGAADDPTRSHGGRGEPDDPERNPRGLPSEDPRALNPPRRTPLMETLSGPAGRPMSAMTGASMPMGSLPMTGGAPASGLPMGGGNPLGWLSSLLQPLEQAAAPATDAAYSSHHSDESGEGDPASREGDRVVNAARRALGLPYVWGGGNAHGPTGGGFDCSGLTQYSVAQATNGQIILPRTTYDQIHVGRQVNPADARPGDLVFSNFSAAGIPEHVQIYAGHGRVIEAQQTGVPVKVSAAPAGHVVIKRVL